MFSNNSNGGGLFGGGGASRLGQPTNSFGQSSGFFGGGFQGPSTTFDFVGSQFTVKNRDGYLVASITASINQLSLEELRINDHFALKKNQLPDQKKQSIESLIQNNIKKRDGQPTSVFGNPPTGGGLLTQPSGPFGQPPQSLLGGPFPGQQLPGSLPGQFTGQGPNATPLTAPSGVFGFGQPLPNTLPQQGLGLGAGLPLPPQQGLGLGLGLGSGLQPTLQAAGLGLSGLPPPPSGGFFGAFGQGGLQSGLNNSSPDKSLTNPSVQPAATEGTLISAAPVQQLGQTNPSTTQAEAPSTGFASGLQASNFFQAANVSKVEETKPSVLTAPKIAPVITNKSVFGVQSQPNNQNPVVISPPKVNAPPRNVQQTVIVPGEFKTQTVTSKPGAFSHEMNKMLFVSSLMDLFGEHNIVFPEDLLDTTDFMPQLFEFLAAYNIKPPQKFVPRFKMNKAAILSVIPAEEQNDYREKEIEAQEAEEAQRPQVQPIIVQSVQKPIAVSKKEERQEESKQIEVPKQETKQGGKQEEQSEQDSEEREEEGSAVVVGDTTEGNEDNSA